MFIHKKCSFLVSLQQVFTDGMVSVQVHDKEDTLASPSVLLHTILSSPPDRVCTQVMVMGHHLAEVVEAHLISML